MDMTGCRAQCFALSSEEKVHISLHKCGASVGIKLIVCTEILNSLLSPLSVWM
jgi:hypothetical protein